jgi:type VI secretion system protein ImpA
MSERADEERKEAADIAALLEPLGAAPGTGLDLRFGSVYRNVTAARREENPLLPQGVWAREIKRADWPTVEQLCTDALRTESKDLQLACWLAEAWLHRRGMAGLADGLRVLAGLCRRFWPSLHPAIEDGDLAPRIAPFEWMNAHFPQLLRAAPIVRAPNEPARAYTLTDFANAQLLEGLRQRDPRSVERSEAAGAVTLAAFTELRRRTDTAFIVRLDGGLRAAAGALAELNAVLAQACGPDAPGLGAVGDAISDMLGMTTIELAARRGVPAIPPIPKAAATPEAESAAGAAAAAPPAETRDRIYGQLTELARLLHQIEPHSPVPYLIARAVAWGDMSLPELLASFADAGLDIGAVFSLLDLNQFSDTVKKMTSDQDII